MNSYGWGNGGVPLDLGTGHVDRMNGDVEGGGFFGVQSSAEILEIVKAWDAYHALGRDRHDDGSERRRYEQTAVEQTAIDGDSSGSFQTDGRSVRGCSREVIRGRS